MSRTDISKDGNRGGAVLARVLHNFKARYPDELSVRFNEIVKVVDTGVVEVSNTLFVHNPFWAVSCSILPILRFICCRRKLLFN